MFLVIAVAATGMATGSSQQAETAVADAHLHTLARFYVDFLRTNQGRAPRDQAEFRDYIEQQSSKRLESDGVRDIDALFISSRDSQPLVILYEGKGGALAERGIIGYESSGNDGKRSVAYRFGSVELLDESEISNAASAK